MATCQGISGATRSLERKGKTVLVTMLTSCLRSSPFQNYERGMLLPLVSNSESSWYVFVVVVGTNVSSHF